LLPSIVTWGHPQYGGNFSSVRQAFTNPLKTVLKICSNDVAFTALLSDFTIVSWGHPDYGGTTPTIVGTFSDCHPAADDSLLTFAPTPAPSRSPTPAPSRQPTPDLLYLDTHPLLTHYYRFDASDIQGSTVLNYATGNYDGTLVNGATVSSLSGNYKVGSSSLNLISAGTNNAEVYNSSPYFKITNGITLGGTALTFAFW